MQKHSLHKKEIHFYQYTDREDDFRRLSLIYGFSALFVLPLFTILAFNTDIPDIYAYVSMFASGYTFLVILVTYLVTPLRTCIFPFHFLFFCGATLFLGWDLIQSGFPPVHKIPFVFLYAVIVISLQRFYYTIIYNTLIAVSISIAGILFSEFSNQLIALGSLVFIAGSVSVLSLYSRNRMISRIQDYSMYLSAIINQPGIGIALIRNEHKPEIVDYNSYFVSLLGLDEDVSDQETKSLLEKIIAERNKSGGNRFEYEIEEKQQWVELFLDEIELYEGVFLLLKVVDITLSKEQRELIHRNETRFRLLFEESNDAIFIMSGGKVINANMNAVGLFQKSQEELQGTNLWDFGAPHLDSELLKEHFERLDEVNNKVRLEWDFIRTDGKIIHVELSLILMFANGERFEQCVVRDITEQKNHEHQLKTTQQTFKNIIENIPEAILLFTRNTVVFANTEAYRMLNFTSDSIYSVELDELFIDKNKDIFIKAINNHGPSKKLVNEQIEIQRFNSDEKIDVEFTLTNTIFNGEKVSMLIINDISLINKLAGQRFRAEVAEEMNKKLVHEIEERRKTEKLLQEQSLKLKAIIENSSNTLIWTVNRDFELLMFNEYFHSTIFHLFSVELSEGVNMVDLFTTYMDEKESEAFRKGMNKVLSGHSTQIENKLSIGEKKYWIETFLNPIIDTEGNVIEISCVSHNSTEKKETEQEIINSLREKEILLKEVHHRVKNNLQVISSILNLQSSYVTDENTRNILQESQNRIKSMSFIHENLYQKDRFSSIDFSEYIFNLSNNLVHSYQIFDNLVEIKYDMEKIHLSLDQAIPCGLIVNELVSNALKYAFPENFDNGELLIKLKKKDEKIELMIGDNGIGLPNNLDINKTDTLGLQLVLTLIDQLDADVEIKREEGTKYFITFELLNV